MKRISENKKLFGVETKIELKSLKKAYRNLVKEWHPDKFQAGDALQEEAEIQSRRIIDGYHFLVSIAPETIEANADQFTQTVNTGIADFQHKSMVLEITFMDGTTYEYFGVTKPIYIKMINSNKVNRFAKRSIYPNYTFRMSKREQEAV
ncbi:DnaJ and KTSC superfamily domain containing protein [Psychroflexus torquis ATCC 700755]|uniref:DnaJ and KTSC superfamily domain containing protein n=1 Tax=Psychroflexus torquis (strain ATCC 700755 / CIP 106069 / ACAM 623) TaxID=313595 RepID=K4IJ05_PSYTT|nr:KTSC domain-containing protein [Psychroflexus torquis]AFU70344.1 DnaJ and KTSC superfamily domain containing protein [Psychroflexus torquis ATCC 700755]